MKNVLLTLFTLSFLLIYVPDADGAHAGVSDMAMTCGSWSGDALEPGDTYFVRGHDRHSGLPHSITYDICRMGPASGNCPATTGTLAGGGQLCLDADETQLIATILTAPDVPPGYSVTYLLTIGEDLLLGSTSEIPEFSVVMPGEYTIHTLVYHEDSLDLAMFVPGETTGAYVLGLLTQGGGDICGALDVTGTTFTVVECIPCNADAGTLHPLLPNVCLVNGSADLEALVNPDVVIPGAEYQHAFILTQGTGAVIIDVGSAPMFTVNSVGTFTIHSLVYDPATLELDFVVPGTTTAAEINALLQQGGGVICASLDLMGAILTVIDCTPANDLCAWAQPLNVYGIEDCPGNETSGTTLFATGSAVIPVCDLSSAGYADVWYVFNSGTNEQVFIHVDAMGMTGWGISVYTDCEGSIVTYCEVEPASSVLVNTAVGTEYLVLIHTNLQNGQPGDFTICISAEAPVNFCLGGTVSVNTGEEDIIICQDPPAPPVTFVSAGIAAQNYAYVLADAEGLIIQVLPGNTVDFNTHGLGTYRVYGVSYNGTLTDATAGEAVADIGSTGDCISVSENHVTVMLEICTGIAATPEHGWELYPNPASGEVNIACRNVEGTVQLQLVDMSGRIVASEMIRMTSGGRHTLPLQGVQAGLYSVVLTSDHARTTMRLVVE